MFTSWINNPQTLMNLQVSLISYEVGRKHLVSLG